jgi:hypothetical protein
MVGDGLGDEVVDGGGFGEIAHGGRPFLQTAIRGKS